MAWTCSSMSVLASLTPVVLVPWAFQNPDSLVESSWARFARTTAQDCHLPAARSFCEYSKFSRLSSQKIIEFLNGPFGIVLNVKWDYCDP